MAGTPMRWDPFAELAELVSRFDHALDEVDSGREQRCSPAADVVRDGGKSVLRAGSPGSSPELVEIEVDDDIPRASGEHRESNADKDNRQMRRERCYGSLSGSMALPAGVEAQRVTVRMHDGAVEATLRLPTADQTAVTFTRTVA
jgi:HSP20 family molecular chaperone IbpA